MTDLRVLQQGRLRRSALRRRRRRLIWRSALVALILCAVAGAVWLKVIRPDAHPGIAAERPAAHAVAKRPAAPKVTALVDHPAGYAQAPAPAALREQVAQNLRGTVALTQPLTEGLLFNVQTGQVLWSRRPDTPLPIASLTKMMTALVTIEHSAPRARVLISKQAIDATGSAVGLLPLGKRVSERDLLYGLLLPSGNDAAIALAQHVGGTQPSFIAMMNAQAQAMGLSCTHYTTVSGVLNAGNHSCAVDLAVLGHAILSNRFLAKVVGSQLAALDFPTAGGKLYLTNNNPLYLANYAGADGVKTGYTTQAGMCLVATAKRHGMWLGVVLLHSANWGTQAEALLNAGFAAERASA